MISTSQNSTVYHWLPFIPEEKNCKTEKMKCLYSLVSNAKHQCELCISCYKLGVFQT